MSLSFVSEAPGELVAVDLAGGQDVRFTRKQQHSGGRATTLTSTRMPDAKPKIGRRESLGVLEEGVSVGDSRAGSRLPGSSGRASGPFFWS
jgi:hypothetical protein